MEEIIRIEQLHKEFHLKKETVVALDEIDLSIQKKDIYGIIGLSGAGKSTLIRCMNFLEKPTSGKVYFEGQDLSELNGKSLRKMRMKIGMIFQGFHLLEQRTVLKNVLYPLELAKVPKEQAVQTAKDLLKLVGLEDKLQAYPQQLSGGQKQRVAIARAIANRPSVLLCDEATSALDPTTTNSILELLKQINEQFGITIVIITHEMRVIEAICNRVAIIDHGKIQEEGPVKEIFVRPSTDIAKSLIFPQIDLKETPMGETCLRLIFDGTALEPLIAEMILKTKAMINILQASIRVVDDKMYGEMILQLPEEENTIAKVKNYLNSSRILYQEEHYGHFTNS